MSKAVCWLCHQPKDLCQSHIIPKFVFRWLTETGGTPYLRKAGTPNRRVQDGDKHLIYCKECELLLSKIESKSKLQLFDHATAANKLEGWYGPWLSRFAVSFAIRTVHSQLYRKIKFEEPINSSLIWAATENWRKFLIGEQTSPKEHSVYMLYPGYFSNFDADHLPQNWNVFIHRAVERDLIFNKTGSFCATYMKIGPLIFFGKVTDTENYLGRDRIACNEGQYGHPLPLKGTVWELLLDRARNYQSALSNLSDAQRKKTEAEVLKDPDRFLNSDLAKQIQADMVQFGTMKPKV